MFCNCLISGERDLPGATDARSKLSPAARAAARRARAVLLEQASGIEEVPVPQRFLRPGRMTRSRSGRIILRRVAQCPHAPQAGFLLLRSAAYRARQGRRAAVAGVVGARINGSFNARRRRESCPASPPPHRTRRRYARCARPGCGRRRPGSPADRTRSPPRPCPRRRAV